MRNPYIETLKMQLAEAIIPEVQKLEMRQSEIAKVLKTNQARVSFLLNKKLAGFSIDVLIKIAVEMGLDVDFQIKKWVRGIDEQKKTI
jgi:predicted XRE-type DNA-binding protein